MQHKLDSWKYPSKLAVIVDEFDLNEVTAAILAQRGHTDTSQAFLNPDFYRPALPDALPDLPQAAERLYAAYQKHESVLLWGDMDTDGLTATALLYEALTMIGMDVQYHIPRQHGIDVLTLHEIYQQKRPAVLVSCDTGTSAHAAARFARENRMDFIVADHHALPPTLPAVTALVTPQRLPAHHPLEHLSAVGVIFLLVQQLYEKLQKAHELNRFLDWVTLGLVADDVPLVDDVRYLVQRGLKALQFSKRPGLVALAEIAGIELSTVTEKEIGFEFVPRLNAFGRLGSAENGFKLLLTRSEGEARILAAQADALNQKRRLLTRQIRQAAQEQIEKDPTLLNWAALVLENPHWEGGVVGAAATLLTEIYKRPVVLLVSGDNETASGSVRGWGGYSVLAALEVVSELLRSFGGHEQAAGLSLLTENIPAFRRRFSQALASQKVEIQPFEADGILPLARATLDLARNLEKLAPFGTGNPRPVFLAREVQLVRSAKVGEQHRRLTLREAGGDTYSVLWWNSSEKALPEGTFELAYQITPVVEEGRYELQITFVDWEQTRPPEVKPLSQIEWIDCRESFSLEAVQQEESSLTVWVEGYSRRESPGVPFSELEPADALLIYTAPSHLKMLQAAIKRVKPRRIYIYGEMPPLNEPDEIVSAVAALLKTEVEVRQVAERLAQPEDTIRLVIEHLPVEWSTRSSVRLQGVVDKMKISPRLRQAIEETAAYRRYFRRADTGNLLE